MYIKVASTENRNAVKTLSFYYRVPSRSINSVYNLVTNHLSYFLIISYFNYLVSQAW